jgi:hypothetical protein
MCNAVAGSDVLRRGGQQALLLLLLQHSMRYAVSAVLGCPLVSCEMHVFCPEAEA